MSVRVPPTVSPERPADAVPSEASGAETRLAVMFALIALVLAAAIDGFLIEPRWIIVSRYHVVAPLSFGGPLKIAHLSDLHTKGIGRRERRLLELLKAEQPDLIVVTGDTLHSSANYKAVHELLGQLHAPLGVWVVRGNWENWHPVKDERGFYASAGVNFLVNEARPVRGNVWMVGLDDPSSGHPHLDQALEGVQADAYTIVLLHSPAHFKHVAGRCALALAGHTHGGQVRIPFVHPFWLPRGSSDYLEGWYQQAGSKMYVSRGIGTSVLPLRFLCRPELAIVTLGK